MPTQPNRKHLTGVAMGQLKAVCDLIQKSEMVVEPSVNQSRNVENDTEERLMITRYELE